MQTTAPGQTTILTESGLPTGVAVGFQVVKAATGLVAVARTELGVQERPAGSGNYVIAFVAPAEGDLYLIVVDWTGGVLAPETTRVTDLQVTAALQPGSSGLGAVADYAKMHLGGETWKGLLDADTYGSTFVQQAVNVVKSRALTTPPDTAGESSLNPQVLDYLGILVALQLIPAARDMWGSTAISLTRGDDASETITYANRTTLMNELRDDLMRLLTAAQAAALPLLDSPLYEMSGRGPEIDEDDDCKVTEDPRDFPRARDFPGVDIGYTDDIGYALPRRSGVRL